MPDLPEYSMPFSRRSTTEKDFLSRWEDLFESSALSPVEKLMNFPMFVARQDLARFLFRAEIFRRILPHHGSVIECGVAYGGGLMAFAHLSAILEPINYTRKIIGFDTFEGFPHVSEKDVGVEKNPDARIGAMASDTHDELERVIEMFDRNRPLGHLPRVELVRGDICETAPRYVRDNQHLIVSLLYLDLDLYEPTKAALETFLPRMPKGSVVAFDEVNHPDWPGETLALLESLDLRGISLKRVAYDTTRCYAIL